MYLKSYFSDEPLFSESKIISSIYEPNFDGTISNKFYEKVAFDKIDEQYLEDLNQANFEALSKIATTHSDGLIMASENLPDSVIKNIKNSKKPHLDFSQSKDEETYIEFYNKF